jgi:branched-subunit amino acid transport protein
VPIWAFVFALAAAIVAFIAAWLTKSLLALALGLLAVAFIFEYATTSSAVHF